MIEQVIDARTRDLGGFEVGRVLPYARRHMVGPFIFLDQMGPARFAPGHGIDVRPHPHIGLATVTYLFEGRIVHRDSTGVHQSIEPGALNWMTAGRGIVHSERTDPALRETGWAMHGMQAWVALPDHAEESAPAFDHYPATDLPLFDEPGVHGRLIAGRAFGLSNPVKVHSPLFYLHVDLAERAATRVPDGHAERAAYVAAGTVTCAGGRYTAGQMLVFAPGDADAVRAVEGPATVMLLGGDPVGERFIWWNLVSSSKERIEQAKADWQQGRMPLPPGDADEFIPLPDA
jgi:redox-sensitive bicupin YhaK (pirin superfamily)